MTNVFRPNPELFDLRCIQCEGFALLRYDLSWNDNGDITIMIYLHCDQCQSLDIITVETYEPGILDRIFLRKG